MAGSDAAMWPMASATSNDYKAKKIRLIVHASHAKWKKLIRNLLTEVIDRVS